jgi:peptidyl-prolyl cis-trans isomerase D
MLKSLRSNTKWIMVAVVVGFIAMIVFDWGMDISSQRRGADAGVIAVINGERISYTTYDSMVQSQTQSLGSSQRLTMDQIRRIHADVWNNIITRTLVKQEIKKRGIKFTDQELVQYILNNPVQYADQISIFQENGKFSIEKYDQFVQNRQNLSSPDTRQLLDIIENEARDVMPLMKLQEDLMNAVVVTDRDVRDQWVKENEKRAIEYTFIDASKLNRLPNSGGDEAVRKYFTAHQADFKQPELRSIQSVFFSLAPTAQDSAMVLDQAAMLVQRIRNGEDFAELANAYTEDTGNTGANGEKHGGDVGIFGRKQMIKEFEDAAFALPQGGVSNPVMSSYGVHIIKVDSLIYGSDKKQVEQVKARHILLTFEPSGETQQDVENRARTFHEKVAGGADFTQTAQNDSLNLQVTPQFPKETQFVPNVGLYADILMNRIFQASLGDVLPIYQNDRGYFVIRVSEIANPGVPQLEQIKQAVTDAYMKEVRIQYAHEYLSKVDARLKQGISLRDAIAATADSFIIATVDSQMVNHTSALAGLNQNNQFVARVFRAPSVGASTGPIDTGNGCGLAVITGIVQLDETTFESQKEEIRKRILSEQQSAVITRFIEKLRSEAKIIDNRAAILTSL